MQGFIALHRKIIEWEWYRDNNTFKLFIHLLLKANHEPQKWQGTIIERGQLATGRNMLVKETGLTEQNIKTSLNKLKSTSEITIKSTNKFSLVTIVNYDLYQTDGKKVTSKVTSKLNNNQPATNQQLTTNNNDNNDNNDNKIIYSEFVTMKLSEYEKLVNEFGEDATKRMIEILSNYKGSSGKKYKSDYLAIKNWVVGRYKQENKPTTQPKTNKFTDYEQGNWGIELTKDELMM